jgi:hypothetical protein
MKTSAEYRQFAAECLRLAARARTDEERGILHHMAETWQKLADEADNGRLKAPG